MPETWHDARALFRFPRPGSALASVVDVDDGITPDTMLLRDLAFMVGKFLFGVTDPVPLTQAERDAVEAAKPPKADLMTPEDALKRLGLTVGEEVSDG